MNMEVFEKLAVLSRLLVNIAEKSFFSRYSQSNAPTFYRQGKLICNCALSRLVGMSVLFHSVLRDGGLFPGIGLPSPRSRLFLGMPFTKFTELLKK